ncbi:MAG: hypothetical protein OJF62_001971 [Pseudolabrys sp.]|jgi:predicted component of viral defense system (DUF524 family)|nr:hypothetical protein [Pseudolabrys sp.]
MGTPVVFRFRRKDQDETLSARSGDTIAFEERVQYVLSFERELTALESLRLKELGSELVGRNIALVSFGNFVGRSEIAGVTVEVVSTKIGPGGVSRLLEEVSSLASSLIFGWRAPTGFESTSDHLRHAPVPYHQLQFLRRALLRERPGQRLQDFLQIIERNPTRRFEPERPVVEVSRVRRLDHRAVQSIFSRLERLVPVSPAVAVSAGALATKLTFGDPPTKHFPARVAAPRGKLSFDTPENRFVRHVIGECLALVYRFVDHPALHESLKADCRLMLGILEQSAAVPFLTEAGRLAGFHSPTQALAKADGYREVFSFWTGLTAHVSLPLSATETVRILEGRDVATLYEYWSFLKLLEATVNITGRRLSGEVAVRRDELGESLSLGLSTGVGPNISISFNPTFRRSNRTAYSTPLRPDVILKVGDALHAFDAKYRLDRFDVAENDPDDDPATYKRVDLYKMHTYRDAISNLRSASVLYPGTEFVFFERSGAKRNAPGSIANADGVGAIPLRPTAADPSGMLRELLTVLLTRPGSPLAS